jgi:hypothetical protein
MSDAINQNERGCGEQQEEKEENQEQEDASDEEQASEERRARQADMERAAKVAILADEDPTALMTVSNDITPNAASLRSEANSDPPSEIAIDSDFDDQFTSITQSLPVSSNELAWYLNFMTAEAMEECFEQLQNTLVDFLQWQYEEQPNQQRSSASLSDEYSEALEQRLREMTDMLDKVQNQQVETLWYYESLASSERTSSLSCPDPCKDPPASHSRSFKSLLERDKLKSFSKPDPPAMDVLVADALEKLDPDSTIQSNAMDPRVRQERLTPPVFLRPSGARDDEKSDLDRKLPCRNTASKPLTILEEQAYGSDLDKKPSASDRHKHF